MCFVLHMNLKVCSKWISLDSPIISDADDENHLRNRMRTAIQTSLNVGLSSLEAVGKPGAYGYGGGFRTHGKHQLLFKSLQSAFSRLDLSRKATTA